MECKCDCHDPAMHMGWGGPDKACSHCSPYHETDERQKAAVKAAFTQLSNENKKLKEENQGLEKDIAFHIEQYRIFESQHMRSSSENGELRHRVDVTEGLWRKEALENIKLRQRNEELEKLVRELRLVRVSKL